MVRSQLVLKCIFNDKAAPERKYLNVLQKVNEPANVSLVRLGFLGCAPVDPAMAVSLDVLELYHRLRRRHGQLSIQAMVRALCDLHDASTPSPYAHSHSHVIQVTYGTFLRDQFSIAFDAYLHILRVIKTRTEEALGRNTPHWRAKNACPPCNYLVSVPCLRQCHY